MRTETIEWVVVTNHLPSDDRRVLVDWVYLDDDGLFVCSSVEAATYDGKYWRAIDLCSPLEGRAFAWAEWPKGPKA